MFNIRDKTICLLGAKRSGRALSELILKYGGIPKVSDSSQDESTILWAAEKKLLWELGAHTSEFVMTSDLIVLSPGVSVHADIIQEARNNNIPVLGEIEFSYQYCEKPVIAITGSNGKTTVSTLISDVLNKAGYQARLCGNVGHPFALYCDDPRLDYFVLEISSFQSESIIGQDIAKIEQLNLAWQKFSGFKPNIAVILNFSENHLDRHKDLDEYFSAKSRLLVNMDDNDRVFLGSQHHRLTSLGSALPIPTAFFDAAENVKKFKTNNPNYLAVYSVAEALKVSKKIVDTVIKDFKGVEHRLERVRTFNGVDYINDSKSTTAEAGRWALNRIEKPIVLICGGKNKNIDFAPLKDLVAKKAKKMILIGEARKKMAEVFSGVVTTEEAGSLSEAVLQAKNSAQKGECVLLSPMCASFDMFQDYEDRGRQFKKIVGELS